MFEDYIRNDRTPRYNIMCSIIAPDKQKPKYVDYTSSCIDRVIPNNTTTSAL